MTPWSKNGSSEILLSPSTKSLRDRCISYITKATVADLYILLHLHNLPLYVSTSCRPSVSRRNTLRSVPYSALCSSQSALLTKGTPDLSRRDDAAHQQVQVCPTSRHTSTGESGLTINSTSLLSVVRSTSNRQVA